MKGQERKVLVYGIADNPGEGEMVGFADLMGAILEGIQEGESGYEARKLLRVEQKDNNGVGVSTVWANDIGQYETALLTDEGTVPVERYDSKEAAEAGHVTWTWFAKDENNKTVTQIGYPGLIDDEEVTIR